MVLTFLLSRGGQIVSCRNVLRQASWPPGNPIQNAVRAGNCPTTGYAVAHPYHECIGRYTESVGMFQDPPSSRPKSRTVASTLGSVARSSAVLLGRQADLGTYFTIVLRHSQHVPESSLLIAPSGQYVTARIEYGSSFSYPRNKQRMALQLFLGLPSC